MDTKNDLEERTFQFAKNTRYFLRKFNNSILNIDDIKQLLRASGSVGANYIEANEFLGDKDFLMKVRICRTEAKECVFFFDYSLN